MEEQPLPLRPTYLPLMPTSVARGPGAAAAQGAVVADDVPASGPGDTTPVAAPGQGRQHERLACRLCSRPARQPDQRKRATGGHRRRVGWSRDDYANAYRSWVSERKASATGGRRRCPTNTVLAKRLPPVGCTLWASLSMCPPPRCEPNRRNQQNTKNKRRVKGQCKRAVGSTNLENR